MNPTQEQLDQYAAKVQPVIDQLQEYAKSQGIAASEFSMACMAITVHSVRINLGCFHEEDQLILEQTLDNLQKTMSALVADILEQEAEKNEIQNND